MRKLLILFLLLLTATAYAADPANPADPEMVARILPTADLTFVDGIDDGDELRLLMQRKNGELLFVGGVKEDSGWILTYSSPLPEGTILGVENFTHSLGIPGEKYYDIVSVAPYADGSWGVSLIYPYNADNELFPLRKHVIYENGQAICGYIGDHPWSDITCIDWTSLPDSYAEAVSRIDNTRWAVVNNPDPADRLNLRCEPSKSSPSLGRYYNRTPVRILEYGEEWCAVRVGPFEGYMMTEFLAFADDMDYVVYAGPWLDIDGDHYPTHPVPDTDAPGQYRAAADDFIILGVKGDFYHVWYPYEEDYAYILSNFLTPGNG